MSTQFAYIQLKCARQVSAGAQVPNLSQVESCGLRSGNARACAFAEGRGVRGALHGRNRGVGARGKTHNAAWAGAGHRLGVASRQHQRNRELKSMRRRVTLADRGYRGLCRPWRLAASIWSKRGVVAVQTGKVQREDVTQIVTANGEVKPVEQNQANVNANSFGKITEILVKEGDHVNKGQLLMRTEDIQQAASVEAQQAAPSKPRSPIFRRRTPAFFLPRPALDTAQADLAQADGKARIKPVKTSNAARGALQGPVDLPTGFRPAPQRLSRRPDGQRFVRGAGGASQSPVPAGPL